MFLVHVRLPSITGHQSSTGLKKVVTYYRKNLVFTLIFLISKGINLQRVVLTVYNPVDCFHIFYEACNKSQYCYLHFRIHHS